MGTGRDLVKLAAKHVDEQYRNVLVPKDNPNWHGPWDCAEFASWCVYQVGEFLYGCTDNNGDPATTEAYTGAWERDSKKLGKRISVELAAATPGAFVLRYPPTPGQMGHIVISDGSANGTVEAHSTKRGVIRGALAGRRWDTGVLVPGITYDQGIEPAAVRPPRLAIYRLTAPAMRDATVKSIQRALRAAGIDPGPIDGEFGPQTHAAVTAFQTLKGLIADGEVGPSTARALGIILPTA